MFLEWYNSWDHSGSVGLSWDGHKWPDMLSGFQHALVLPTCLAPTTLLPGVAVRPKLMLPHEFWIMLITGRRGKEIESMACWLPNLPGRKQEFGNDLPQLGATD